MTHELSITMHEVTNKLLLSIAFSLAFLSTVTWAQSHTEVESSLARINPNLTALRIEDTPMSGIYDILLNNNDRIYMSADGEFFFVGTMYQNSLGERLVDLTEQNAIKARIVAMQSPEAQQAWIFPAHGEKKASITVFTDIDCFYCQKLHAEIAAINGLGIEVRYLAFPRAGLDSSSHQVLVDSWCAENRNQFLTEAKIRSHNKQTPQKSPELCDNPVAAHFNLGQQVGVRGTPAIMLNSGELWPGYLSASELAKRLGIL